jgi:hypothetical protein
MPSYKCPTCGTTLSTLTRQSLQELIAIHIRAHQTRQPPAGGGGGEAEMNSQKTGKGGTATARPKQGGGLPQLEAIQAAPYREVRKW